MGNHAAYALTLLLSKQVLRQPGLWVPVLRDYLDQNPFTLVSVEVSPDVFPEEINPLWQLAKGRHHPIDRDYTVTHTPYRSFLVFSRSRGLVWKWPDPRESGPLMLPDGQAIPCHPVCLVAGPEEGPPRWFIDHMAQRYQNLPEIRQWESPDNHSH
jgi:hypothetical protein